MAVVNEPSIVADVIVDDADKVQTAADVTSSEVKLLIWLPAEPVPSSVSLLVSPATALPITTPESDEPVSSVSWLTPPPVNLIEPSTPVIEPALVTVSSAPEAVRKRRSARR